MDGSLGLTSFHQAAILNLSHWIELIVPENVTCPKLSAWLVCALHQPCHTGSPNRTARLPIGSANWFNIDTWRHFHVIHVRCESIITRRGLQIIKPSIMTMFLNIHLQLCVPLRFCWVRKMSWVLLVRCKKGEVCCRDWRVPVFQGLHGYHLSGPHSVGCCSDSSHHRHLSPFPDYSNSQG